MNIPNQPEQVEVTIETREHALLGAQCERREASQEKGCQRPLVLNKASAPLESALGQMIRSPTSIV